MTADKPTPEEKLFAVIQGAKHPPLRAKAQVISLASAGPWLSSLMGPMDLARINQLLTWVIAGMGLLCVASPVLMRPHGDRMVAAAQQQAAPFVMPSPLEGLKTTQAYVELLRSQDPFRIEAQATVPKAEQPPTVQEPHIRPGPDPKTVLADLKLVGISLSPEPIAMIEQVSTQQTYFLKPGDLIGQAMVKEILSDRVVLHVGDQDMDLF